DEVVRLPACPGSGQPKRRNRDARTGSHSIRENALIEQDVGRQAAGCGGSDRGLPRVVPRRLYRFPRSTEERWLRLEAVSSWPHEPDDLRTRVREQPPGERHAESAHLYHAN